MFLFLEHHLPHTFTKTPGVAESTLNKKHQPNYNVFLTLVVKFPLSYLDREM